MPLTSWSDPVKPGCYHAKVVKCEEKRSKGGTGDPMFAVTFAQVGGDTLCDDWIMLGGGGKRSGIEKLMALGFTAADLPIREEQVVGKTAYIDLVQQESTSKTGKVYTDVRVARGGRAPCSGYWPGAQPPTGDVIVMAVPEMFRPDDSQVPF